MSALSAVCGAALLAHEGGWDEILLVLVPILLIGGLLAVVKRRVDAAASGVPDGSEPVSVDDPGSVS